MNLDSASSQSTSTSTTTTKTSSSTPTSTKPTPSTCKDLRKKCKIWANAGYCKWGHWKKWMWKNCKKSCKKCKWSISIIFVVTAYLKMKIKILYELKMFWYFQQNKCCFWLHTPELRFFFSLENCFMFCKWELLFSV